MTKKIVDLKINIDGLILANESVEDFIQRIGSGVDSNYDIQYEVLYEEVID